MDIIILKSFIPELFLSLCTLLILIINIRLIRKSTNNYPIINKEIFYQIFFILVCLLFLYSNLKIEGQFSNLLFDNNESTRIMKIILTIICLFTLTTIKKTFLIEIINYYEYFVIFLIAILSLLLLISSTDLIFFYLVIEMQSLCFFILSSFKRDSSFSAEAGLKYFISGAFISGIFLFGSSLIYLTLGTLNLNNINMLLSFNFNDKNIIFNYFILAGILCITFTLLFKITCAPFHFWSPDVYEGSPITSTIIFSIIPKLSLIFFFIKWICNINFFFYNVQILFLICGVFSAFIGTFYALNQKKVKKLIIYSSISQIGFIVAGLSINCLESFSYVFFYLFIYILTSVLFWNNYSIFYISQYFTTKKLSSIYFSNLPNFLKENNIWGFIFIIVFFSMGGIPPLTGFLSKILIFFEMILSQYLNASILLIIISSISVFYYIRTIKITFFEPKFKENLSENFELFLNNDVNITSLFNIFLLFLLLFVFFFPNVLILFCQYIILNIQTF